jgi:hypothetical protein
MGLNVTGLAALRTFTNTRTSIANGAVGTLANFFNTTNAFTNENGGILRNAGLPENYFVENPQFSTVTLNANGGNSTYHSLVLQATKRLSHGMTFQASYTWSKAIGEDS